MCDEIWEGDVITHVRKTCPLNFVCMCTSARCHLIDDCAAQAVSNLFSRRVRVGSGLTFNILFLLLSAILMRKGAPCRLQWDAVAVGVCLSIQIKPLISGARPQQRRDCERGSARPAAQRARWISVPWYEDLVVEEGSVFASKTRRAA